MKEFSASVNEFLAFRRYEVLLDKNKGIVSRQEAWDKAHKEYDIFNRTQVIHSDFDDMVRELRMSRLEELIQELCPNGVEYKRQQ